MLDTPAPELGSRALFPALEARAYLAHAAISPASTRVVGAVSELLHDYARLGVRAFLPWQRQRERLREALATLVGAAAEDIALTPGTTRGISDLALSYAWRPGDRVLLFRGEFPANVTPWQQAAELFALELEWLDADEFRRDLGAALARFERSLAAGVRLVAVSAVQFQTGLRMPLERMGALCRAHGAAFAVDAVQACGVLPVDVERWHADFLTCGAHKWLMGLEGAGFLYARRERQAELRPFVAGWLSHEHGADFLFLGPGHLRYDRPLKSNVGVFEGSTAPAAGFAALGASVATLLELGIENITDHVTRYLDHVELELVDRGFRSLRPLDAERRSGILSLEPPPGVDVVDLQRDLAARGVITSIPDGKLRLSPHWPNGIHEVRIVTDAVDAL